MSLTDAVNELMSDLEEIYADFLSANGLHDHPVVRFGFYAAAQEEAMEDSLEDARLQVLFVKALKEKAEAAYAEVREVEHFHKKD